MKEKDVPTGKMYILVQLIKRLRRLIPWAKPLYTETRWPTPGVRRRRSVFIRVIDCGSSNAAEQEILAIFNPVYDAESYGFHLVASPRHADLLLITGPLTRNMEGPLLNAFHAMPGPRWVVTIGDDIAGDSVFQHSYATVPLPQEISSVRLAHIPGSPPNPDQILETLLTLKLTR